jgi:hypothetical protein
MVDAATLPLHRDCSDQLQRERYCHPGQEQRQRQQAGEFVDLSQRDLAVLHYFARRA